MKVIFSFIISTSSIFIVNLFFNSLINFSTRISGAEAPEEIPIVLQLAILSNGTPALLKELVKSNNLDNIFDDLFSVEQVRIYKPDSKVYDMPINKYCIEKNEVAFLSANTWDVSGGGNYGYQSIWVNRNKNIFDNLDYKANYEVKDLSELINLVQLSKTN